MAAGSVAPFYDDGPRPSQMGLACEGDDTKPGWARTFRENSPPLLAQIQVEIEPRPANRREPGQDMDLFSPAAVIKSRDHANRDQART
jgi:hypothetical protein